MKTKLFLLFLICFFPFSSAFAAFDKQQIIEKISNKYIDWEKFSASFTLDLNINVIGTLKKSQISCWKHNEKFRLDYVSEERGRMSIIFTGNEYIFYNERINVVDKIDFKKIAKFEFSKIPPEGLQKKSKSPGELLKEHQKFFEELYAPGVNELLHTLYDMIFLSPNFLKYDEKIIKEKIIKGPLKGADTTAYVRYPITETRVKEHLEGGKVYYIFTKEDVPIDLSGIELLFDDKHFNAIIGVDKKEQVFKKVLFWVDADTYSITKTEFFDDFGCPGLVVNNITISSESPPANIFEFYIPRDAIVNNLADALIEMDGVLKD